MKFAKFAGLVHVVTTLLPLAFGSGATTFLYVFYAAAAFIAAAGVLLIDDVDKGLKRGGGNWGATALSASRLLIDSPVARCTAAGGAELGKWAVPRRAPF